MRLIKIGSDKLNDIHQDFENDPTVSRFHCEIFLDDDGNIFLKDKESTNGTYLNGNKISEPKMLEEFDVIRVGNTVLDWKGFIMNEAKEEVQKNKSSSNNLIVKNDNDKKEESEKKTINKNSLSKYFSFEDEYISGGTYWLRCFLQSVLILAFGLGLYLAGVTAYKRSRSLLCSHGTSIFFSIIISIGFFIPFINFIAIGIHIYLRISNGDKEKIKKTLKI